MTKTKMFECKAGHGTCSHRSCAKDRIEREWRPAKVAIKQDKKIPAVGTMVRRVGTEHLYKVVEAHAHGCRAVLVDEKARIASRDNLIPVDRKMHSLAVSSEFGHLFDDRWQTWEIV